MEVSGMVRGAHGQPVLTAGRAAEVRGMPEYGRMVGRLGSMLTWPAMLSTLEVCVRLYSLSVCVYACVCVCESWR